LHPDSVALFNEYHMAVIMSIRKTTYVGGMKKSVDKKGTEKYERVSAKSTKRGCIVVGEHNSASLSSLNPLIYEISTGSQTAARILRL